METKFTRTQWITAFLIATVNIFCSIGISIQAPFYPAEAERKGASATEYGIVFGSFEIVNFIACPLVGKIVTIHEPRRLVAGGIIICSTAMILFGLLDRVEDKNLFIGLSIILRMIEAVGSSSAYVTGYSIVGNVFPDDVSTMIGAMEMFYGVGLILGPAVGGLLFELDGFSLPFISAGVFGIIIFLLTLIVLPRTEDCSNEQKETYEIFSALRIPGILFYTVTMVLSSAFEGFYLTLLATHLGQFHLSPEMLAILFVILSVAYSIVSPFIGRALDSGAVRPSTSIIWSGILAITSLTLIGPAPYLHFQFLIVAYLGIRPLHKHSLLNQIFTCATLSLAVVFRNLKTCLVRYYWNPYSVREVTIPICMVASAMLGFSLGVNYVTTYTGQLESARGAGLADGPGLTAVISGIWTGSISFGGFIGPIIGGILYDHYGFRSATQFFVAAYIIQLIGTIIFKRITKRKDGNDYTQLNSGIDECTPILKNSFFESSCQYT